jgi:hypothetical protein
MQRRTLTAGLTAACLLVALMFALVPVPAAATSWAFAPYVTGFPNDGVAGPFSLAFNPAGELFVVDINDGNVYILPPGASGMTAAQGKHAPAGDSPTAIAFSRDYLHLYVSETTSGNIAELDRTTGQVINPSVVSGLLFPQDIAVDPISGDLFLAEPAGYSAIVRISSPGDPVLIQQTYYNIPESALAVAFAADGTFFFSMGNSIDMFTAADLAGNPNPTPTPVIDLSNGVTGIAVEKGVGPGAVPPRGLLVADGAGNLIEVDLRGTPAVPSTLLTLPQHIYGSAVGFDGCLYLTGVDTVYRVTGDGTCSLGLNPPVGNAPIELKHGYADVRSHDLVDLFTDCEEAGCGVAVGFTEYGVTGIEWSTFITSWGADCSQVFTRITREDFVANHTQVTPGDHADVQIADSTVNFDGSASHQVAGAQDYAGPTFTPPAEFAHSTKENFESYQYRSPVIRGKISAWSPDVSILDLARLIVTKDVPHFDYDVFKMTCTNNPTGGVQLTATYGGVGAMSTTTIDPSFPVSGPEAVTTTANVAPPPTLTGGFTWAKAATLCIQHPDHESIKTNEANKCSASNQPTMATFCINGADWLCNLPPLTVQVDGRTVPDLILAQKLTSVSQALGTDPSQASTQQAAIAMAALDELLLANARDNDQMASPQSARASAQQALAFIVQHPELASTLPPGVSPQDYFTSNSTIAAYRDWITIGAQRTAIAGAFSLSANRTPALAQWMRGELAVHPVAVSGIAGFSLPDALPPNV